MENAKKYNPYDNFLSVLEKTAEKIGLSEETLKILSSPEKQIDVTLAVRMDDGTLRTFRGYRVQHSSLRGPYKGGIRYHQDVDIEGKGSFRLDDDEMRRCGYPVRRRKRRYLRGSENPFEGRA